MTATPNHALQRTAPCVTAPASTAAFPPAMQVPRRTPRSLSLGSLDLMTLTRAFPLFLVAVLALAADDAAIIDGPNYSFSIRAPDGWRMTSTRQLQAAFYLADTTFEKTRVLLYVRSADNQQLHVATIEELNKLDLHGIQQQHPNATSKKVGSARLLEGRFQFMPSPEAVTSSEWHTPSSPRPSQSSLRAQRQQMGSTPQRKLSVTSSALIFLFQRPSARRSTSEV